MTDEAELSISELRRRRAQQSAAAGNPPPPPEPTRELVQPVVIETRVRPSQPATVMQPAAPQPRPRPSGGRTPPPEPTFDKSRLIEAMRLRWGWMLLAAILGAIIGCGIGFWRADYTIPITFTLRDLSTRFVPGSDTEAYHPPQLSLQTRMEFLDSPELLRYVASQANPPMREKQLRSRLKVSQEKDSETMTVTLTGQDLQGLLALANLYASAAMDQSRLAQLENPNLTYNNLTNRLAQTVKEQNELAGKLGILRNTAAIVNPLIESSAYEKEWTDTQLKIDIKESELEQLQGRAEILKDEPLQKELHEAENRLMTLRAQGKLDQHPDVQRVRSEIDELKQQMNGTKPGTFYSSVDNETAMRKKALQVEINELKKRSEAQKTKIDKLYENAGEYAQLKAGYDRLHNFHEKVEQRIFEAQQYRDNAEGYYKVPAPPSLEDVDAHSRHFQSARGGLAGGCMGLALAFFLIYGTERLDTRLKTAADVKRVTDLPVLAGLGDLNKMDEAARKAWAFRTWTILSGSLSQSANHGTVCGIISCASGEGRTTWVEMLVDAARQRGLEVTKLQFQHDEAEKPVTAPIETAPVASNVPATVASQSLTQSRNTSIIHVQLPGTVWDLARRIQFQEELEKWQAAPHAVVLIDLPPASVPEAILLAESLPQVLWLVDSGKSQARETRLHLETLRHARCKLVGAVLNHEPEPLIKL